MKPLNRFFTTFCAIYIVTTSSIFAQYDFIRAYDRASSPEEKCKAFDDLANYYMRNNLDSVRVISMDMLLYADEKKNDYAFNVARKNLGSYFIRSGKEIQGIAELNKAKSFFVQKENYDFVTEIFNEIGNGYQYQGKNEIALLNYQKSLKIGEQANDEFIRKIGLINQAQAFLNLNKLDSAMISAQLYRDWTLQLNRVESTANAYAVIGKIEEARGDLNEAIVNYRQSEVFARKIDSKIQQSHAYTNLAIALFLQGKEEESLQYFELALELRKKVSNIVLLCDAYLNMGEIHAELKNDELALKNYMEGLQIAKHSDKLKNQIEFLDALINFYNLKGDVQEIEQLTIEKKKAEEALLDKENLSYQLDEIVLNELRMDESKYKTSGQKKLSWGFYLGALIIFIVAAFFGLRGRLI